LGRPVPWWSAAAARSFNACLAKTGSEEACEAEDKAALLCASIRVLDSLKK
jgi:hypothetical protein